MSGWDDVPATSPLMDAWQMSPLRIPPPGHYAFCRLPAPIRLVKRLQPKDRGSGSCTPALVGVTI